MRKAKIINIENIGEVTVKEVDLLAVYRAMSAKNKIEEMRSLFADCVVLPGGKPQSIYSSEVEQIVDAFLEVNNSFLAITGKLALKDTITGLVRDLPTILTPTLAELSKLLPPIFVDSYKMVMAKLPGIMAGAASSQPSQPLTAESNEQQ